MEYGTIQKVNCLDPVQRSENGPKVITRAQLGYSTVHRCYSAGPCQVASTLIAQLEPRRPQPPCFTVPGRSTALGGGRAARRLVWTTDPCAIDCSSCISTVPGQHHGKNKCWTKRPCGRARSRSALAARPLPSEIGLQAHASRPRSKTCSRFARQLPCRPGPSRVTGRRARLHGARRTPGIRP